VAQQGIEEGEMAGRLARTEAGGVSATTGKYRPQIRFSVCFVCAPVVTERVLILTGQSLASQFRNQ